MIVFTFWRDAFLLTVLFCWFSETDAQDRGVIFIGNSTSDLATDFTYSFTQINTQQDVPIFATVFANGNPDSTVAKAEDITVSCSVLNTGTGFSRLSINDITLSNTIDSGTISFVPQADGRTVSVQCSAQSTTGTCPIGTGSAQFCPQTSQSNAVSVKVLPPATVTQCKLANSVVITGTQNDTFAVRLSEPALTSVTVRCTSSTSSLNMIAYQLVLPAGSINGEVNFRVQGGNAGDSTQVTCTAQSASGSQFTTASSQVDASTAVFTLRDISLTFEPSSVRVYNTTVTIHFKKEAHDIDDNNELSAVYIIDFHAGYGKCYFYLILPFTTDAVEGSMDKHERFSTRLIGHQFGRITWLEDDISSEWRK